MLDVQSMRICFADDNNEEQSVNWKVGNRVMEDYDIEDQITLVDLRSRILHDDLNS